MIPCIKDIMLKLQAVHQTLSSSYFVSWNNLQFEEKLIHCEQKTISKVAILDALKLSKESSIGAVSKHQPRRLVPRGFPLFKRCEWYPIDLCSNGEHSSQSS